MCVYTYTQQQPNIRPKDEQENERKKAACHFVSCTNTHKHMHTREDTRKITLEHDKNLNCLNLFHNLNDSTLWIIELICCEIAGFLKIKIISKIKIIR